MRLGRLLRVGELGGGRFLFIRDTNYGHRDAIDEDGEEDRQQWFRSMWEGSTQAMEVTNQPVTTKESAADDDEEVEEEEEDAFGDDFDDFAEGDEDEDFGGFDEAEEPAAHHTPVLPQIPEILNQEIRLIENFFVDRNGMCFDPLARNSFMRFSLLP